MLRQLGVRPWLFAMVGVACVVAVGCGSAEQGVKPATAAPASVLDGTEKSVVIVGYSTSYAWPEMLQDMLDEHAGDDRLYHVLNAVVGGSPVSRWIGDPTREDYDDTFGAMVHDFFGREPRLRDDLPEPSVASYPGSCLPWNRGEAESASSSVV